MKMIKRAEYPSQVHFSEALCRPYWKVPGQATDRDAPKPVCPLGRGGAGVAVGRRVAAGAEPAAAPMAPAAPLAAPSTRIRGLAQLVQVVIG